MDPARQALSRPSSTTAGERRRPTTTARRPTQAERPQAAARSRPAPSLTSSPGRRDRACDRHRRRSDGADARRARADRRRGRRPRPGRADRPRTARPARRCASATSPSPARPTADQVQAPTATAAPTSTDPAERSQAPATPPTSTAEPVRLRRRSCPTERRRPCIPTAGRPARSGDFASQQRGAATDARSSCVTGPPRRSTATEPDDGPAARQQLQQDAQPTAKAATSRRTQAEHRRPASPRSSGASRHRRRPPLRPLRRGRRHESTAPPARRRPRRPRPPVDPLHRRRRRATDVADRPDRRRRPRARRPRPGHRRHARRHRRASPRRFLRTDRHPAADGRAPTPTRFDDVYETADAIDEVYPAIVERLVAAAGRARRGPLRRARLAAGGRAHRRAAASADDRVERRGRCRRCRSSTWRGSGSASTRCAAGVRAGRRPPLRGRGGGRAGPAARRPSATPRECCPTSSWRSTTPPADARSSCCSASACPTSRSSTVAWADLDRAVEPDHLTSLYIPELAAPVAGELAALRRAGAPSARAECPWDREQTHRILTRHLLEETYEVLEAIDAPRRRRPATGYEHLEEELGDLLFQVVFHATLAAEEGRFTAGRRGPRRPRQARRAATRTCSATSRSTAPTTWSPTGSRSRRPRRAASQRVRRHPDRPCRPLALRRSKVAAARPTSALAAPSTAPPRSTAADRGRRPRAERSAPAGRRRPACVAARPRAAEAVARPTADRTEPSARRLPASDRMRAVGWPRVRRRGRRGPPCATTGVTFSPPATRSHHRHEHHRAHRRPRDPRLAGQPHRRGRGRPRLAAPPGRAIVPSGASTGPVRGGRAARRRRPLRRQGRARRRRQRQRRDRRRRSTASTPSTSASSTSC